MRRGFIAAGLFLAACRSTGGGAPTGPESDGALEVIVANQQSASASILNDAGTAFSHVQVGNGPHEAAISPDGRTGVIAVYGAQQPGNQLAVLDLVRDSVIRTIDLGTYTRPHGAVFLGDSNTRVAVTSESTGNVVIVNLSSGALQAVPTNARASHMVAVNAAGTRAWTANVIDHTVSELDLTTGTFVRSFTVPNMPEGITATPDGAEVWVGSNETGAVSVISTATGSITHTLDGMTFPYRLAASPDGTRIAIVDGEANQLVIADRATHAVVGSITLAAPRGVAIGADNRTA